MVAAVDTVLAISMLADIILKFKKAGVEVSLEDLADKIVQKEAEHALLKQRLDG